MNTPPEPPAIIKSIQDMAESDAEARRIRDKIKDDTEQGVDQSNRPTTSGK
ncbi:hypothetical protein AB0A63_05725 [Lentzea sp. NPDC042327]|uniref:hypothetical protein n=1 Tax=Lentzea sp. NPDC042327 TaxID=3154801 RepID=UPI0033E14CBA